ncbi:placenta-specific gene 8 protein [Anolis carolinensis]|uniref:Placenta associated 8 n=1 Tax=Anolis carolinensis TaxID=28377 RepID=R4G9J2_ANOCA|nr:PREDICTED: placenta-specific gene 8 protein [Anolis carolinensis]XP_008109211.1 PREDICTED: placenta-specific gene 8 protein [Anolis carolinensis]XP_008109212.1 PREDICTED: placenta-specific gene 8 protein [Anolis carolinensis]|eukprot:XP_003221268.1 PREDICTED: placenta-specific gene 8 protein [Anolis carolinensis]
MSTPVIMSQPQVVVVQQQSPQWQTDLLDCFSDCGICLCGTFFPLCLGCQVAADMDECCLCGPTMAMRSVYRTKYGIPGSLLGDFCVNLWCPHCALCQLKRDINKRRDMGIF